MPDIVASDFRSSILARAPFWTLAAMLAAAAVFDSGCAPAPETAQQSEEKGAAAKEIVIGVYGDMSGDTATFGQSTKEGVDLAVAEANNGAGVLGKKVKVFVENDQGRPEEATSAVRKLISQNHVVAVLGEVASSRSIAAAPICQAKKVPMISPSSTNPEVTQKGDFIFRVCWIDPFQGTVMAKFATESLKLTRVAILRDVKNDYSVGLADFFTQSFTKMGGQVVSDVSYSAGDSDFSAQLTSLKRSNPEAIFIPGYYTEAGLIARQVRQLGMKQVLLGGDGWDSPKLTEIGGEALDGAFFSTHYSIDDPSPQIQGFVKKYRDTYRKDPDGIAALAYDAANLLFDAMKRADSTDGQKVRDQLAVSKDFPGVTGTITIDADRNAVKPAVVLEIKGGKLVFKETINP